MTTYNTQQSKVYGNAINAYQKSQTLSLTPLEIVVEIYKILMENLISAKLCLAEKKIEQQFYHAKKCIRVLTVLMSHLDFEAAPEQAEFLDRAYRIVMGKLANVLLQPDPVAEYDKIIDFLQPLFKRWQDLAKDQRSDLANKMSEQANAPKSSDKTDATA